MDRGAWWAAVHGVTRNQTRWSDFTFTFRFHALEKEMATHSSSCLENPRDGGAWWAAVSGVAQSRTRLNRLGSSSIILKLSFLSTSAVFLRVVLLSESPEDLLRIRISRPLSRLSKGAGMHSLTPAPVPQHHL